MIPNISSWKSLSLLRCCWLSHSISANTWEIVFFFVYVFVRAHDHLTRCHPFRNNMPARQLCFALLSCTHRLFSAGLYWRIWFMESNEVFTSIHIIIHMMLCVWIAPCRLIILQWLTMMIFSTRRTNQSSIDDSFFFLCQWPTR